MSSASKGHAESLPETAISRAIGRLITVIGESSSWLWLVLVLVIIGQVLLRYVFGQGSILLEELQWHIYGIGFLLGVGYCLQADRHVRIDVVAEKFSPRTRAGIEIAGIAIFLLPFAIGVMIEGGKLAYTAWHLNEISAAPGGLSHRWVIKSFIPLGFGLIALAAFARLTRCAALLFGFPKPISRD
ncbi:TRAP transporter small permease subunit [Magnetospirillum sp. SS-4]|uniref:TRAP transporter small permease subunit n=1 Tax=Magnetospirillum sp. SS-4 TaxID=2681465 RepID=UPI0013833398|nr:TRAP transporter small permease subunit [Magnetospirillum sp. SS-4]CAA7627542.1 TRAP-type mannitol/chloroaromatic compound transporter [Magnetospirillum sp. SS-4]